MNIRKLQESDHTSIIAVVDEWWGGRHMSGLLPRLFFTYFQDTSFVIEEDGQITAFLIGFISQTNPGEAYIHFVGVHPDYRRRKIGKHLYNQFFDRVEERGCHTVRCITSPVNKVSIVYHTRMGFVMEKGDIEVDGVPVHKDYDGPGNDRVLFVKKII
ncbi:GNAT family N-acetyltransferase [Paenactinomyces guangxiensis]|uniref:GNAT family N-acetyltransferase n=1 Tax=Paenactinomyces guangxiensis TaxID=1490290 RepID=A0A7W1WUF1_9BACL|nr:GNAT family N-acetyltransferase [Paenactinomyces guangxiensis]MBA4496260.1 GNAT family N-acetyltransferase [Paenactinomyces guangxiensis]MBH8593358.1 GNAT family N-acetyltransferase [Paenactinomyces guangxiensis]